LERWQKSVQERAERVSREQEEEEEEEAYIDR
jgi:hypothetical protein